MKNNKRRSMFKSIIDFIKRLFGRKSSPTPPTRGPVSDGSGGSGGGDDDGRIDGTLPNSGGF